MLAGLEPPAARLGSDQLDPGDDYPLFAIRVSTAVVADQDAGIDAFGVLVLLWLLARATVNGGSFDAHEHTGVACVSLYWHTVDVVWLFIVACLYVSPHLY